MHTKRLRIRRGIYISREHAKTLATFMLLAFTQVDLSIQHGISKTGMSSISITALLLILYFIMKTVHDSFCGVITRNSPILLRTCGWIWIIILNTILRYVFQGSFVLSITMSCTFISGISMFFLIAENHIKTRHFWNGVVLFFSLLNIYMLYLIVVSKGNIRTADMSIIIGNLNVYITCALISIPIITIWLNSAVNSIMRKALFLGNYMTAGMVFLLSGSRVGLIGFVTEAIVLAHYSRKYFGTKSLARMNIRIIGISLLIGGLFLSNNHMLQSVLLRGIYYPYRLVRQVVSGKSLQQEEADKILGYSADALKNKEDIIYFLSLDDRRYEDPNIDRLPTEEKYSLTRPLLWIRTWHVLKSHWLFGTGRSAVYMRNWGYQSTHNIILDAVLCFGAIGSMLYLSVLYYPINKTMSNKSGYSKLYACGFLIVLLFAMVEPVLSNRPLITILLWGGFASTNCREKDRCPRTQGVTGVNCS